MEVLTYNVRLAMPVFRNQQGVPMRDSHRAVQVISDHRATQARSNLQEDLPEEDNKERSYIKLISEKEEEDHGLPLLFICNLIL